ncbi:uncharacterized protein LOC126973752 [Leptidea sinapis]|uniref:uncharacterized protein LOC126973752 n=1 Tax=Leptidea sinapis TaxID=189913 RepID=UPI00214459CC|nr:uncharacterized protein LOC126973752 [Leptidea sinapis]
MSRNELSMELNQNKMGDKKFHSDTSLQKYGDDDEDTEITDDPGVQNISIISSAQNLEDIPGRRRTMSQPGPISGSLLTATAARTARKRPPRNVVYASDIEKGMNDRLNTPISNNDLSLPPTPSGERRSPGPYIYRNGDVKSLNSYRLPLNDMRGGATPRKRSVVTMDAQSIRSVETHAPPPTSPEDNARLSKKYLSLILSCIYAVLLVTLGCIIFPSDPFVSYDNSPSIVFAFCLVGIGFLYQIFLLYDINRYKIIALKNQKTKEVHDTKLSEYFRKQDEEYATTGELGDRTPEGNKAIGFPTPVLLPLNHDYCFSSGRHSGSFYLKLGAAGFALGYLIHSVHYFSFCFSTSHSL